MGFMPAKTLEQLLIHRAAKPPNEHLCTCGKLREHCVRKAVRAMWR
jgi:hypothetical protein